MRALLLACAFAFAGSSQFPWLFLTSPPSPSSSGGSTERSPPPPPRSSSGGWRPRIFFMQTTTQPEPASSSGGTTGGGQSDFYLSNTDVELYRERKRNLAKELQSVDLDEREIDNYANPSMNKNRQANSGGNKRRPWPSFLQSLPELSLRCDPVINFKIKQRLSYLGACVTVGVDYLSDLAQWRAFCAVEDTLLHGRFSLKGSELSWAKSFYINLGLGEDAAAKFKLRCGYNLNTHKLYARLRFRAEPLSCFDIAEGLSAAGKLPLPGLVPLLRSIPLRVEYRLRINTPSGDEAEAGRGGRRFSRASGDAVHFTTGIERVELSLDELNFCLEWDEKSPLWDIGLSRGRDLQSKRKDVVVKPSPSALDNPPPLAASLLRPGPQRVASPGSGPRAAPRSGPARSAGSVSRSSSPSSSSSSSSTSPGAARR